MPNDDIRTRMMQAFTSGSYGDDQYRRGKEQKTSIKSVENRYAMDPTKHPYTRKALGKVLKSDLQ